MENRNASAYGWPSVAQGTAKIDGWEFTSAFDSGNALHNSWKCSSTKQGNANVSIKEFSVMIAQDCHGHPQHAKLKNFWFYFGVTPPDPHFKGEIKLMVWGMSQQVDLFRSGYSPWVSTPSQPRWQRVTGEVEAGSLDDYGWRVKWDHHFDGCPGMTRFAFCHPYSYSELRAWLDRLEVIFLRPPSQVKNAPVDVARTPAEALLKARQKDKVTASEFLKEFRREEKQFLTDWNLGPEGSTLREAREDLDPEKELYYFEARDWHGEVPQAGEGVYFHRQVIARTPRGRAVEMLTVTEAPEGWPQQVPGDEWPREALPEAVAEALMSWQPVQSDDSPNDMELPPPESTHSPLYFKGRQVCFFSGRVHPGETPGQFAINGLLQFVLSDDPRAVELRKRFVFKVCPMLNPDGVAWGHSRTNTLGLDLNRCYRSPVPELHEGVFAAKEMLLAWAMRGELLLYMDSHAHAAKRGCFLFSNHQLSQAWSSEDALLWNLAYVHATQLNSPHMDIDASEWSRPAESLGKKTPDDEDTGGAEETSRSDSGRSQIGASCGIFHAYTLECNYHMSRTVRPVPDAPGLRAHAQYVQMPEGSIFDGEPGRAGYGKRPLPAPYAHNAWAAVGEALAVALLDLHGLSLHSRLTVALPPKPLLKPDPDLVDATAGLERLFNALAARHRQAVLTSSAADQLQLGLRRRVWHVVHEPHVYMRGQPAKDGAPLGIRKTGDKIAVLDVRRDGWAQIDPKEFEENVRKRKNLNATEGFMLIDGKSLGLGKLLSDTGEMVHVSIPAVASGAVPARLAPWVEHVEQGLYPSASPSSCGPEQALPASACIDSIAEALQASACSDLIAEDMKPAEIDTSVT